MARSGDKSMLTFPLKYALISALVESGKDGVWGEEESLPHINAIESIPQSNHFFKGYKSVFCRNSGRTLGHPWSLATLPTCARSASWDSPHHSINFLKNSILLLYFSLKGYSPQVRQELRILCVSSFPLKGCLLVFKAQTVLYLKASFQEDPALICDQQTGLPMYTLLHLVPPRHRVCVKNLKWLSVS